MASLTFKQFLQESSLVGNIVQLTKGPHKGKKVKIVGHSTNEDLWMVREIKNGKPTGKPFSVHRDDHLKEAVVRRNDPEMDDYYNTDSTPTPQQQIGEGPYAVGWRAQSFEWYGDDDPSSGNGRYKPKGDGGKWVAINVPSYQQAQKIANRLDDAYQGKKFPEKAVYARQGKDFYVLDYWGAHVVPMNKLDQYDLDSAVRYDKAKDYAAR